jgi:membrane protein DedA with SNARE-associated domain
LESVVTFLLSYFTNLRYLGIFSILFLCGLGLPIPEDITIIASGYLSYIGELELFPSFVVCMSGVLVGDFTIYCIGRFFGLRITQKKIFKKIFTDERINRATHFSQKYGGKTIFFARFLPGLRAPIYLTAGFIKVSILKFLILDSLAALVSVPFILYVAHYFGEEIKSAITVISHAKNWAAIILVLVVVAFMLTKKWRKHAAQKMNAL